MTSTTEFDGDRVPLTTREEAWTQLAACLYAQLETPKREWPEFVHEHEEEARLFLAENPADTGPGTTVTMKLAPASLIELKSMFDRGLDKMQEQLDLLSQTADLISELAGAEEFWASVVEAQIILAPTEDGEERRVELTSAEREWLREVMGRVMLYAGRKSQTGVFNPTPITTSSDDPPAQEIDNDLGLTITTAPVTETPAAAVKPVHPLTAVREARKSTPLPETPGVEVWEGADDHDCREYLDVDDLCETCGRHVPTGAGGRVVV